MSNYDPSHVHTVLKGTAGTGVSVFGYITSPDKFIGAMQAVFTILIPLLTAASLYYQVLRQRSKLKDEDMVREFYRKKRLEQETKHHIAKEKSSTSDENSGNI